MAVVMLSASEETCPRIGVCQSSDPTSDADLEGTDKNAAWAGIAVVIVLVVVSVAVWLAIRRRRRARGGHNSVDTGPRLSLPRRMALFWRRPTAHSLSVEHESKPPRPSSSASNLKRMTTIEITSPPPAKLPERSDAPGQYPMLPLRNTDATAKPEPLPSHGASQNPRNSVASSQRSSISRLSMPPPGLGPPMPHPGSHQPEIAPST